RRSVLYHQAAGHGHRACAVAADRRGPPGEPLAGKPQGSTRRPRPAQASIGDLAIISRVTSLLPPRSREGFWGIRAGPPQWWFRNNQTRLRGLCGFAVEVEPFLSVQKGNDGVAEGIGGDLDPGRLGA